MDAVPLTVIVPVLDERHVLPQTLAALCRLPDGCELIVVDGGSRDGSESIVRRFPRVRSLAAPRGRAAQMNHGARHARGHTLLFLHADTVLPPAAPQLIEAALAAPAVAAGSFRLCFAPSSPLLRLYAACSRLNLLVTTFGDQGLFVRRALFERIGGFAEIAFMEDVEIQRRLRRRGRFVKLDAAVITSARRFLERGPLRQQLRNVALVLLYLAGVSPQRLKRFYGDARTGAAPARRRRERLS